MGNLGQNESFMNTNKNDVTNRFSDRVSHYIQSRPGYPAELVERFIEAAGLSNRFRIADIGSGTGILARSFLENGCRVVGVEPNDEMRNAAEALLAEFPRFESQNGSAEETGLNDASVDAVMVGQAFHWFDVDSFRKEMLRILRSHRWAMLVWNNRSLDATPFLRAYEAFLQEWGTDYREVSSRYEDLDSLKCFFGGEFETVTYENCQDFSREGLRERLLSSSYVPGPEHDRQAPMLEALDRLFDAHADSDRATFIYDTTMYYGKIVD